MPTREEIEWFESLYFDYDKNPDLGNFLIENLELTQELVYVCGKESVPGMFLYFLPKAKHLIKSAEDLRVLIDLVGSCDSSRQKKLIFGGILPSILTGGIYDAYFKKFIHCIADLRVLIDFVKLVDPDFKLFFENEQIFIECVNEAYAGKGFSVKKTLIKLNRYKFPGFSNAFYDKLDPRISRFKNVEEVSELLKKSKKGKKDFEKWYVKFNAKRLKKLGALGIDLDYWLGRKAVRFNDVVINVGTGEKEGIIYRELPKLRGWFDFLLDCVNDRNFVLVQIFARIKKASDLENLFVFLKESPANIPPFVRDIVFKIVQEKADLSSIPENDLRKLVNTFYGRELGRAKAKRDNQLANEVESEFEFVRAMDHAQLVRDLPRLRVGSYLQTRLAEFSRASPKQGRESDLSRAIHELESVAQAVQNLLAEQSEKYKTSFKDKYYVNFRVSDKFPLEVLTIGADGHACIQPGGQAEIIGFNFFKDSDALLIEILSKKILKSERIGMILAFACVGEKNRPVLGLNTVEIAKSWPDDVKDSFYEASTEWLIEFAKKAGFKAIMIGNGYGSEYFLKKYGRRIVRFRKLNAFPTKIPYITNTFEQGMYYQLSEGIMLTYDYETGTIIWEE